MSTQVRIRFGRGELDVPVPDSAHVTVIRKPDMPVLENPTDHVRAALAEARPSLRSLASQANSACIAICDITRPVPNHLFLRPMIETLLSAGMNADRICVLVATGLHRPNEGDELRELVGDPWVLDTVPVVNHHARRDAEHVTVGDTRTRGTVVRLDRRFVEADLRIATGLVEPHFMAGYSGGRKVVAPGLAHADTITTFHSARFMADPATRNCNFVGNPLHEEQLEIIRMIGGAWALNTVVDEQRNLSFVNFGEILASHADAVEFARGYCQVPIDRQYSTVITSAAGYPLDQTYYQTIKAMVGAMDLLAPQGDLIVAAECSEGLGSAEFAQAQQRLVAQGREQFLIDLLGKPRAAIDEWQTQMQLEPLRRGNVHLYSTGLSEAQWPLTGVHRVRSLRDAIAASLKRSPDQAVAVIPEGPYVIPVLPEVHSS